MRIHCDACEKNLATVMCCADEAALCADCDARIHAVHKGSDKHVRVSLLAAPEPAKCDICQEKRGFFFCLEDRALLCRDCDVSIHKANTLSCNHKRFLVPGMRVALEELKEEQQQQPGESAPAAAASSEFCSSMPSPACSTMSSQSSHCSRASALSSPTSTLQGPRAFTSQSKASALAASVYRAPAVSSYCPPPAAYVPDMKLQQQFSAAVPALVSLPSSVPGGGMRKSSIGEFLTDAVPGWRVDELLNFADCTEGFNSTDFASAKLDGVTAAGGDYDWTADLSLFEEQMFAMHEVPQFPPPAPQLAAPPRSSARSGGPRHARSRASNNGSRNQDVYDLPNISNNFNDAFIVPVIRNPSPPASQSLPKRMKRDMYHMSSH